SATTPEFSRPLPPQLEPYTYLAHVTHFGFGANGEFIVKHSDTAPIGGILLHRACQEYKNAAILRQAGAVAPCPLLVAQYCALTFQKQKLGVVVSLLPDELPFRLDSIFYESVSASEIEREYSRKVFERMGEDPRSPGSRSVVLSRVYSSYGNELRR